MRLTAFNFRRSGFNPERPFSKTPNVRNPNVQKSRPRTSEPRTSKPRGENPECLKPECLQPRTSIRGIDCINRIDHGECILTVLAVSIVFIEDLRKYHSQYSLTDNLKARDDIASKRKVSTLIYLTATQQMQAAVAYIDSAYQS